MPKERLLKLPISETSVDIKWSTSNSLRSLFTPIDKNTDNSPIDDLENKIASSPKGAATTIGKEPKSGQ